VSALNLFVLPYVSLEDNHSILGQTELPQSLTSLLSLALNGAHIPDTSHTSVVLEILRVGANFCMDHGQQVLDLFTHPLTHKFGWKTRTVQLFLT